MKLFGVPMYTYINYSRKNYFRERDARDTKATEIKAFIDLWANDVLVLTFSKKLCHYIVLNCCHVVFGLMTLVLVSKEKKR